MRISHVVAVFLLALAGMTWFFDQELKRKRDRCLDFCANYETPREFDKMTSASAKPLPSATTTSDEMRYFQCGCDVEPLISNEK